MRRDDGIGEQAFFLLLAVLFCLSLVAQIGTSFSQGPNNRNVSVDTRVNITGSAPEILRVTPLAYPNITLSAGGQTKIYCNLTIRDYNGYGDISNVTARFFKNATSSYGVADDNNTHYTNLTCNRWQQSGAFANYSCAIDVWYFANAGQWDCAAWVNDTIGLNDSGRNVTWIDPLLALNVTTLIDYGDMAIGDTSPDQQANISNLGNQPINVSVRGYGVTIGDGLGFVCDQGTLTVDLEHFHRNSGVAYASKQVLGANRAQVSGLTISKAVDITGSQNSTYWQLFLDPAQNAFGLCNGTIVFHAQTST